MRIPFDLPCMGCLDYKPSKVQSFPVFIQPKLQGINARYWQGKFYSRNNEVWRDEVVEHMVLELKEVLDCMPDDIMLHGEFYRHGWTQGEHTSNINVNLWNPTEKTREVKFCVFDFWKPQCSVSFAGRQMVLVKNKTPNLVQSWLALSHSEIEKWYQECLRLGYEGCVISKSTGVYTNGKSNLKMKLKQWRDKEYLIIGIEKGSGKNLKRLGALVCGTLEGKKFNVGSGFTDKQRQEYWDKPPIGKFVTVKYQNLSEDGIPCPPIFVGIRDYE